MSDNPRICTRCGSTEWYIDYNYSRTTRNLYSINDDGSVNNDDSEELDGDDSGSEDDPCCTNCGRGYFLSLEEVDSSEIAELLKVADVSIRLTLAHLLIDGKEIDWAQQVEKSPEPEPEANLKRKFIGKKVIQR
jgi:ribosomal protein S27AE